uniref:Uncharacterized protein n=1 Tax=Ixodes ricinus TaxID=34613 RepID=A0A6B0UJ95_IXORI
MRTTGSSTAALTFLRNVTASLPSMSRWSYVRQMYIMGRISTFPATLTGRSKTACMPRMADWGGLMMGVPNMEPKTPPLLMVKVPPSMSSMAKLPVRAFSPRTLIAFSMSA